MLSLSCETLHYALLPREEDMRAAYSFGESPVLCWFKGSEMGAGSHTGDGLIQLLSSHKAKPYRYLCYHKYLAR